MAPLLIFLTILGLALWLTRGRKKDRAPAEKSPSLHATPAPNADVTDRTPDSVKDAEEMAFIDLETTGLDPATDRIIEVGVCIVPLGVVGTARGYSELANPGTPIPSRITNLTGITNEMVRDNHPTDDVVGRFLDHIGSRPIAAYNAKFDMAFLRSEAARIGRAVPNESHCIMEYTKRKHPNLPRYRLSDVCEAFGIEVEPREGLQEHRALYDTERAVKLYFEVAKGSAPKVVDQPRAEWRRRDYSQQDRYHDIRSSAKEEFRKAKAAEAVDLPDAIAGYGRAIELLVQAGHIPMYLGERTGTGSGDIECLNRLTMCQCKLGRGDEARVAMDAYFAAFPRESELKAADQIRRRVSKAVGRAQNQETA